MVGLTVEQVKAGGIDNGRFRMPTEADYNNMADWRIYGTQPPSGISTDNTTYGIMSAANTFLPASGWLSDSGRSISRGVVGTSWTSRPEDENYGRRAWWNSQNPPGLGLDDGGIAAQAYQVRCIGQNLYPVSAAANAGGTAKVTSDTAGANVITAFNEGGGVTFTATPTDGNTEFSRWTLSGAGAAMVNVSASDLSRNPLTVSMPAGDLTATASFVPASFRIGNYVWAGSNVDLPGTFAAGRYDFGRLYQYPSSTSPEEIRGVAWVGVDNPATLASMGTSAGIDMQGNDVAWDAAYWDVDGWAYGGWLAEYNPCPTGWHIPSQAEWQNLMDNTTDTPGTHIENGVEGHVFTITSGDTDRIFFLPQTWQRREADGRVYPGAVNTTHYWSTSGYYGDARTVAWDHGSPFFLYTAHPATANAVRCVRLP